MSYIKLSEKSTKKLDEWVQNAIRKELDPADIRLHVKVVSVKPVVNVVK